MPDSRNHEASHSDHTYKAAPDSAPIHCENEAKSDSIQLMAPINPSLAMMRYGHEPTLFNSVISSHLPDATPLVAQWFYDLVGFGLSFFTAAQYRQCFRVIRLRTFINFKRFPLLCTVRSINEKSLCVFVQINTLEINETPNGR